MHVRAEGEVGGGGYEQTDAFFSCLSVYLSVCVSLSFLFWIKQKTGMGWETGSGARRGGEKGGGR